MTSSSKRDRKHVVGREHPEGNDGDGNTQDEADGDVAWMLRTKVQAGRRRYHQNAENDDLPEIARALAGLAC